MCGFAAFFSTDALEPRFQASSPWTGLLAHRGPDGTRSWRDPSAAMHFTRLSIIDLSDEGMQPMHSICGRYVMTYNGEIVNFRDLARTYGLSPRTGSDTEVLLELYRLLQDEVGKVLRGMFSFVIYDKKERSAVAYRDPFGIKPLYYAQEGSVLMLASEMKPLLEALGGSPLEEDQVVRFLRRGEIDDGKKTFYRKIKQLPPGHRLVWKNGDLRVEPYRRDSFQTRTGSEDRLEQEAYHQTLLRVVKQYLYADVPLGVGLSGGFDSSLLAHLVRANRPEPAPLHMFTRGYKDYEGNELDAARAVGKRFGFQFHPVILSPGEVPSLLRTCSEQQEHPITSLSILAYHKLYREASCAGVKVLLEGHGGDEIWAGYASYTRSDGAGYSHDGSSFRMNEEILLPSWRAAAAIGGRTTSPSWRAAAAIGGRTTSPSWRGLPSGPEEPSWVPPGASPLTGRQLGDLFGSKLQRSLRFVDRASMAAGVEVRVPYLDTELAFPALRWPDHWKVKNGELRTLVRRMARTYLTDAVALRPKVLIQDPQRRWLENELREFVMDLLHSRPLHIEQFVDVAVLTRYYESFLEDPRRFGNLTFLVFPVFLEAWYQAIQGSFTQQKEVGCG